VFTFRKALAGIAAIVVLVFAGAGAATLFSSSPTSPARAVALGGPGVGIKLAFGRFNVQVRSARAPGPFRGTVTLGQLRGALALGQLRGALALGQLRGAVTPGQHRGLHPLLQALRQALGRVFGRILGASSCRLRIGKALSRSSRTPAAQLSHRNLSVGVAPVVASLFGSSARRLTVTAKAGAQATVRPCAIPVPMSHLPGAGSPGTGSAPQTSLSPPPG
jgi:hypothetical protein